MGGADIQGLASLGANVIALCDVDQTRSAGARKNFPKATVYKDFRKILDKEEKKSTQSAWEPPTIFMPWWRWTPSDGANTSTAKSH